VTTKVNDCKIQVFVQEVMKEFEKNVQIQKRVPQCEMSAPGRAETS
jgi:hypothetical protein